MCLGLGLPHSLYPSITSPFAGEVIEDGGRSGEASPCFSGDMHGEVGEEGASWMVGGSGTDGRDWRHLCNISFEPSSRGVRGEEGRGPGNRPERIGKPGGPPKGLGLLKALPLPLSCGLVWRALARSSKNISSWEPPDEGREFGLGKGFKPPRAIASSLILFLKIWDFKMLDYSKASGILEN